MGQCPPRRLKRRPKSASREVVRECLSTLENLHNNFDALLLKRWPIRLRAAVCAPTLRGRLACFSAIRPGAVGGDVLVRGSAWLVAGRVSQDAMTSVKKDPPSEGFKHKIKRKEDLSFAQRKIKTDAFLYKDVAAVLHDACRSPPNQGQAHGTALGTHLHQRRRVYPEKPTRTQERVSDRTEGSVWRSRHAAGGTQPTDVQQRPQ